MVTAFECPTDNDPVETAWSRSEDGEMVGPKDERREFFSVRSLDQEKICACKMEITGSGRPVYPLDRQLVHHLRIDKFIRPCR